MLFFHTRNLNEKLYERMIQNFCAHTNQNVHEFFKKWTIHIFSLEDTNPAYYDHIALGNGERIAAGITSGVTGMFEIKLWLHDSTDNFKNRENAVTVCHELAHAVLFHRYGSEGNYHVKRVHGNTNRFKMSFWYRSKFLWRRFTASLAAITILKSIIEKRKLAETIVRKILLRHNFDKSIFITLFLT